MKHNKEVQSVDIPNKIKCEICQHESISTSALKGHISLKHDPTIMVFCELCNFRASSDNEMENHNINHKHELPATEINKLSIHKEARSEDDFIVCSSSPIQGSQTLHKCFTVDCPNMTDNIEPKVNINWIWYTNIPLCDSCIL